MTVAPALIWLSLAAVACGEDPVLKAAREEAAAGKGQAGSSGKGTASAGGQVGTAQRGHPMDGGVAAGSSAPDGSGAGDAGEPVPGIPDEPTPAPPGTPGGGKPPAQDGEAGQVGVAGEPPPGVPDEPRPGNPDEPSPSGRRPPPTAGPKVLLSGTVAYDGFSGGMLRVDIFDGDHLRQGAKRPSVVAMVNLDGPGPFQVEVPVSAGRVWVSAFNDADRNERPGPLDPTGFYDGNPVPTDRGPQKNLTVRLIQRAPPEDGGDDL